MDKTDRDVIETCRRERLSYNASHLAYADERGYAADHRYREMATDHYTYWRDVPAEEIVAGRPLLLIDGRGLGDE